MHRPLTILVTLIILCGFLVSATPYTHYRLPTSIQPDRYKLKIITHLEDPSNLHFDGQVTIRFKVLEDTSNITLHVKNLTIDETKITLESCSDKTFRLHPKDIDTVPEQDYYIIGLCKPLRKGETYSVNLFFSGILNEELYGYYRSSYVEKETNETRWLSATDFEPANARNAFPCFDEPNYKAKFIIWLGHHKSLTALSNMPMEKQIPLNGTDNFVWSIFQESVPMSTYLVAYTINDFAYKSSKQAKGSKVTFRTWSRKDVIDHSDYAVEVGPKVLKYYEDIFGIPFPLPKVDEIAIPDFSSGAMENWGLIIYKESYLLFAPNVSSASNRQQIAATIAHELAHQWFGNLVTMKWWTDVWLNEGFATYISNLAIQNLNPEWDFFNKNSLSNMLTIFRIDSRLSSHPISQPILSVGQIGEAFDSISYQKGSAVLRMMHMFLGQNGFTEGIRDYLKKFAYNNAEQDDLWAAFTEKAHKYNRIEPQHDMKTIMDSWTLQTGYPLVTVNRDYKTGSIKVTQQRYLENSDILKEQAHTCWWIPLSYTTASKLDFMTTMPNTWLECDKSNKSITLKLNNVAKANEWIMFNIQLSGVYRVMYDAENWRLLTQTLNSAKFSSIHVMNRAQLINDAISLAWSGHHDYDVAFNVLDYLIQEHEYLPWTSALPGLKTVNSLLRHFKEHHEYFKSYMRYLIKPVYNYLDGLNDTVFESTSDMHTRLLHKSLVTNWACYLEVEDCVQSAVNYFQQWKKSKTPNSENIIPVDLRDTVYCTAIRHGDKDDWQFLWQRYMESNVATEKADMYSALACSRNNEILKSYIDLIFDKNEYIRKQDAIYAFIGVIDNSDVASHALDYFVEHISDLNEFFGPHSGYLGELLVYLASQIISTEDQNKLINIIETHKDYFAESEKSVQRALEIINFNIKWIGHNLQDMMDRLKIRLSPKGHVKA